jgi:hypothetical protein
MQFILLLVFQISHMLLPDILVHCTLIKMLIYD